MPITAKRVQQHVSTARATNLRVQKKKQGKSPTVILREFRRQNINTSYCNGTVGAGAINRAAIELGLLSRPEPGKFFVAYSVTKKGASLGIKSNNRAVKYSEEAVNIIRNFFQTNTHINHGFVKS